MAMASSWTGTEGTLVGGTEAGAGNVVSGNQVGIAINGTGQVVQGNEIGRAGVGNLQYGVAIWSGGSDNLIGGTEPGEGNSIAFNLIGVRVMDATTSGNKILGNAIRSNGRLGIDLGAEGVTLNDSGDADTGPNGLQNFPELTSVEVTGASGTLDSGGASYRIEFFRNPACDGEGAEFLGALEGQAPGAFAFPVALAVGDVITATATDEATGDTSEFSACKTAVGALPNDPPVVDAGADDTGTEGSSVALSGSATDPDDSPTLLWTALGTGTDAGASCTFANAAAAVTSVTCTDDGTWTLTLTADDGTNEPVADSLTLVLANADPVVGAGDDQPGVLVGATVSLDPATFSDAGANDTHGAQIDWGDGTVVAGSVGTGSVSGSHAYGTPGTYTVTVSVTDDDGGTGSDTFVVTVGAESWLRRTST